MQLIKHRLVWLALLTTIFIIVSYNYIDKALVTYLVAHHSRHILLLKHLANDITSTIIVLMMLFYAYFIVTVTRQTLNTVDKKLMIACNAIVTTIFLKDGLKTVFGRPWADTFICNNPSFLKDHLYGFHWFTNSPTFASFPSGHAAVISAFATSFWLLFPRLRLLWCALAGLVIVGQVGMYYHFLSDVIAGMALGTLVGIYTYLYSTEQ
jgi:membrane-associated phospholipid phosphatase